MTKKGVGSKKSADDFRSEKLSPKWIHEPIWAEFDCRARSKFRKAVQKTSLSSFIAQEEAALGEAEECPGTAADFQPAAKKNLVFESPFELDGLENR